MTYKFVRSLMESNSRVCLVPNRNYTWIWGPFVNAAKEERVKAKDRDRGMKNCKCSYFSFDSGLESRRE